MLVQLTRDSDNTARQGPLADMQRQLRDMQADLKRMQNSLDRMHQPDRTYDWAKIYKQTLTNKIQGHIYNHVWVDESDTLPTELFEESK